MALGPAPATEGATSQAAVPRSLLLSGRHRPSPPPCLTTLTLAPAAPPASSAIDSPCTWVFSLTRRKKFKPLSSPISSIS
jgi:hypothetical protein